jgi:hypothetical protein
MSPRHARPRDTTPEVLRFFQAVGWLVFGWFTGGVVIAVPVAVAYVVGA